MSFSSVFCAPDGNAGEFFDPTDTTTEYTITYSGYEQAEFGCAVSIENDLIAAGAKREDNQNGSDAGSVYVFEYVSAGRWNQIGRIVPSDGEAFEYFGESVAAAGRSPPVQPEPAAEPFTIPYPPILLRVHGRER